MRPEELRAAYTDGRRDFRGVRLRRAGLGRVNLAGINLSGADLSGTDLQGADLKGAYLPGISLRGALLGKAEGKHVLTALGVAGALLGLSRYVWRRSIGSYTSASSSILTRFGPDAVLTPADTEDVQVATLRLRSWQLVPPAG